MKLLYHLFDGRRGVRWLAQRYPAPGPPRGSAIRKQVVRIGRVRWRSCTTVAFSDDGLFLHVEPPGHAFPAILIPWCEIAGVERIRLYGLAALRLCCSDPAAPPIDIYAKHVEEMRPYLSGSILD